MLSFSQQSYEVQEEWMIQRLFSQKWMKYKRQVEIACLVLYNTHMEKLNLDRNKTYILGVSGGPDSMALFDMCIKQGIQIVVAHMNYQKRESALRDMNIVKEYSKIHGIIFEFCMQNKECEGNFQAFAREERYHFYETLIIKYQADGVLLAHQLDDHLETYIMQKQKNKKAHYYGIKKDTFVLGCHVLRPLLHYTKALLEAYCQIHQVPYGIDESNLTDDYLRNQIRHEKIESMTYSEKLALCEEIKQSNAQCITLRNAAGKFYENWNKEISTLIHIENALLEEVITSMIYEYTSSHISYALLKEICQLIQNNAKKWTKALNKPYYMYVEYGLLCIDSEEDKSYAVHYDHLQFEKQNYFEISKQGCGVEALTLRKEDFPITIRSFKKGDEILLRFGKKKVNRWFIDRKIPKKERRLWPVVVNAKGNVILVPKIGCDIEHFSNNPTCFVLK